MTLKIVTDSTCDLPETFIAKYDITVVPLHINFGNQTYRDGVDLSRQEFYTRLLNYPAYPFTAAPGPETFRQIYRVLAAEGATEILSIHVSGKLSATLNNALLAAQKTNSLPITVLNSQQLSLGTGFLVMAAARAAAEGQTVEEIVPQLKAQIARTHVFAVLDTLEFVRRSGRVNILLATLGRLLRVKPLFKMHGGTITCERFRTRRQAVTRLLDWLDDLSPLEEMALIHSHALEPAQALRAQAQSRLPTPDQLPIMEAGPIIGAHVGPGAVGVACVAAT